MNELSKALADFVQTLNGDAKSLGDMLHRISPDVWKLTIYQVQVEGFRNITVWWLISAIIFAVGFKFHRVRKNLQEGDSEAVCYYIGTWVFVCVAVFIVIVSAGVNFDYIINPQYEAMNRILRMLRYGHD
jgi:hypothetical protein